MPSPEPFPIPEEAVSAAVYAWLLHPLPDPGESMTAAIRAALPLLGIATLLEDAAATIENLEKRCNDEFEGHNIAGELRALAAAMRGPL